MMTNNLQAALHDLSGCPTTKHPFFSIYLDWVPDGTGRRQSLQALEQSLDAIAADLAGDSAHRAGFAADRQRIVDYLNREAPRDARGLAIFACQDAGIWMALPLQSQVPTQVVVDRYPHVFELARLVDEYETTAVVLAEGQEARIFVIALNQAEQVGETEASEKIKRFDVRHVVIAGNDSIKGMVMDSLTEPIKQKLLDYIHLDPTSSLKTIVETVEPMLRDAERQQEAADLAELEKQATAKGGLAALGLADTAMAIGKGQVSALLMLQSFAAAGGECPNCGMLRAGQRSKCPYDGAEMQPVDLREAFTARAIQQNAAVQIVAASDYLAAHDGVGALLRYRDDEQAREVG